jgi:hypothetical protein
MTSYYILFLTVLISELNIKFEKQKSERKSKYLKIKGLSFPLFGRLKV